MCRSIEDGGRRCRCTTPEAAAEKRRKRNEAQKRYLKRKAAAASVAEPVTTTTEVTEPETPDYDADAAHAEALQRLHTVVTASKAMEDQAHADAVAAAMEAVADAPNPFEGIAIPEPETTVSIDEAFAAHMAREAAEERAREEQERRDASPRRAQVEANFFALMDELRGVTPT
ncbi:hypothetical protein [Mycobacteroides abscessus]|uniref:hypothetical protein n=1 Tax=Mycobacteroides abscessus TaxID=36809 RepID=UPI000C26193F|nr:hypothetical protein [Mycobacteroides abscessus]